MIGTIDRIEEFVGEEALHLLACAAPHGANLARSSELNLVTDPAAGCLCPKCHPPKAPSADSSGHANIGAGGGDDEGYTHPEIMGCKRPVRCGWCDACKKFEGR